MKGFLLSFAQTAMTRINHCPTAHLQNVHFVGAAGPKLYGVAGFVVRVKEKRPSQKVREGWNSAAIVG